MSSTTTSQIGTGTWVIDPVHSSAEFAVKHMMVATAKGRFTKLSGTITLDEANPAAASVEANVDVTSVDTGQPQRDGHLRNDDFFSADQYPQATFRSTRVELDGAEAAKVYGDLTIRGISKPVVLDVEFEGAGQDAYGKQRAGFTATTAINRLDYGIQWNPAIETGGFVVSNRVKLTLHIRRRPPGLVTTALNRATSPRSGGAVYVPTEVVPRRTSLTFHHTHTGATTMSTVAQYTPTTTIDPQPRLASLALTVAKYRTLALLLHRGDRPRHPGARRHQRHPRGRRQPLLLLNERTGAAEWPRGGRTTGLYHFAILVPTREDLSWLQHWLELGLPLPGQGDHVVVSEALYLEDPDKHGIEVYRDRPRDTLAVERPPGPDEGTGPVDIRGLLTEAANSDAPWTGMAAGTRLGRMHLQVGNIGQAARSATSSASTSSRGCRPRSSSRPVATTTTSA